MVKNYLFRSFSSSIWRMSFPTEYNAELAQNRREGGRQVLQTHEHSKQRGKKKGRKVENRNAQAMSKQAGLTSVGMLKNNARSHALQDLQF